ncbi:MAG: sigma-70 family RNA polymerase sigma factor [Thermoanaerobaculia bacterium]|nr:sigma-70 family RNA polymerase sigma factor [Thermoanaerobaculia bacterium]
MRLQRNSTYAMHEPGQSAEQLFLKNLDQIEALLRIVARRYAMRDDEAEEFGAWVKLKIVESDYAVLRKFRGEAKLRTYLTTVLVRLAKDWLIAQRGKWRVSALAQNSSLSAIQLEKLISYDGRGMDEAVEVLKRNFGASESRTELRRLAEELPRHPPRSQVSLEAIGESPARTRADRDVEESEKRAQAARVARAVSEALAELERDDRLLLQMRFDRGMTVASIARMMDEPQRPLYSRLTRLFGGLREDLEERGVGIEEVRQVLGWIDGELDIDYHVEEDALRDEASSEPAEIPRRSSVPSSEGRRAGRRLR